MVTSSRSRPLRFGALLLATALVPAIAGAQQVHRPLEVYGTVGLGQKYLDEAYPDHGEFGGGARFFFTPRFGVEADLLAFHPYWNTPYEHSRIGYVTVVGTWGSSTGTVRPYWLGGVAVAAGRHVNTAVGPTGGVGARIFFGDRYFLAPEVRGPIFRASLSGGIALRR